MRTYVYEVVHFDRYDNEYVLRPLYANLSAAENAGEIRLEEYHSLTDVQLAYQDVTESPLGVVRAANFGKDAIHIRAEEVVEEA